MTETAWTFPVQNRVALSMNGVLVAVCSGLQTIESLASLKSQLEQEAQEQRKQQHKVLILIDVSRVPEFNPETFESARTALGQLDFDSMSVLGGGKAFRATAGKFVAAAKLQNKIHFFDTSSDASNWLAGDVVQQTSSAEALAHPIWPKRREKRTI